MQGEVRRVKLLQPPQVTTTNATATSNCLSTSPFDIICTEYKSLKCPPPSSLQETTQPVTTEDLSLKRQQRRVPTNSTACKPTILLYGLKPATGWSGVSVTRLRRSKTFSTPLYIAGLSPARRLPSLTREAFLCLPCHSLGALQPYLSLPHIYSMLVHGAHARLQPHWPLVPLPSSFQKVLPQALLAMLAVDARGQ